MRTNTEWMYWGRRDPLWSVASWKGKDAGNAGAWTAQEFLALGASDFADVLRHWEQYGLYRGRCVEIGCGAGRMTKQLADVFDRVVALDVSPDQVARAKELLGPVAQKVEFRIVQEAVIPEPDGSCDAMFSCHVLQHLPGMRAVASYLRESHRVLRPNGSACFHLPVPGAHLTSPQSDLWYWARNVYKRFKRFFGILNIAEYHRYHTRDVFSMLMNLGFKNLQLRIFPMTSNGDYHSYFLARKP